MDLEDLKSVAFEVLATAGSIFLGLAHPALRRRPEPEVAGRDRRADLGVALVVLTLAGACYLACLPVRYVIRAARTRGAKPLAKNGDFEL